MRFVLLVYRWAVALLLLAGGPTVLWKSSSLSLWLLHEVGEEWALGSANVVHLESGGLLLTNPGALVRWTMPFWVLALAMISGGVMLLWPAGRKIPSSPK